MRLRLVQPRPVAFPSWAIVAMVGGVGRGHGRAQLFHSHARLSPHRSLSSSLAHQRWCSCLTPPVAQVPGTAVPGELRRDAPATRWRRARELVSIRSSPTAPSIRPSRCCAPQRATQERKKASPILSQMSHSYSPHISAALVLSPVDLSRARAAALIDGAARLSEVAAKEASAADGSSDDAITAEQLALEKFQVSFRTPTTRPPHAHHTATNTPYRPPSTDPPYRPPVQTPRTDPPYRPPVQTTPYRPPVQTTPYRPPVQTPRTDPPLRTPLLQPPLLQTPTPSAPSQC